MARSTESTIVYPPPYSVTDDTTSKQSWSILFTPINAIISHKLKNVGMCFIFIGMIAIGLEAKLLSTGSREISYIGYEIDMFGIHLFALGLIVVILCNLQVYVLTAVFILHFWELIYLIRRLVTYSLVIKDWNKACVSTLSDPYCIFETRAVVVSSLVCVCLAILLTMSNMFMMRDAVDPKSRALQQQAIPVAYLRPNTAVISQ